jgi:hypothetical protein
MVHGARDEDVRVTQVTRHKEGQYLPATIRKLLVALRPAIKDEADVTWPVPLTDDVVARGQYSYASVEHGIQNFAIGFREIGERGEV